MRQLNIEWRHYEKAGETCVRCSATGKTLGDVIADLREELAPRGVEVTFTETKLPIEKLDQSNMILFNGVPMEDLLKGAVVSENACASCSCLIGTETLCRTVEYEGQTYEEIPEMLIREAALKSLGLD
jgi:hypothetical protein